MASDKQISANRINAQKSTGPKTPEGKRESSQNALKTGIDAKSEIIRLENPTEHADLAASFQARFAPATPEELSLVDALIRFEWLSRRYACVDTAVWENRFAVRETRSLGEVFLAESTIICRGVAAFNSVRRGFNATLKQLNDLQAKRTKNPEIAEIAAIPAEPGPESTTATKPLNPKSASFLQFPNPAPDPSPAPLPDPQKVAESPDPQPETPPKAA